MIHKPTRNRLPSDRIFNSDVMSSQARIDDMTMQIKVRIHPDRAPPPPDPRAARRDLRDPREVFFPPSRATISVFLRRLRDAAGPPRADPRAPLSFEQNAHLRVGSGFIQYPPQRPFAQPVQVQPPTLSVRSSDTFSQVFAGFRPGWESIDAARHLPRAADAVHPAGPLDLARDHPRRTSRGSRRRDLTAGRHRATRRAASDPAPADATGIPRFAACQLSFFPR